MNGEIKQGEVVELKSGGPKMTVARLFEHNKVMRAMCQWFEGNKQQEGHFPVSSLKRSDQN